MSTSDPFGFEAATAQSDQSLDISAFTPKARAVDRPAVEASRAAARDAGFTRRTAPTPPEQAAVPASAGRTRGRKRRVNITEVLGLQDRYPETERCQLNMLAPLPIALRWRALVQKHQVPAWEILEAAMDALDASGADPAARARIAGEVA